LRLLRIFAASYAIDPQITDSMPKACVIANGKEVPADLPCSLEAFLIAQKLLPRSVVVELNGDAVAPSEFAAHQLQTGDRLEIVRIVAGG